MDGGGEGGGGLTSLLNNKLLYLMSPINHKARRRRPALSVSACSADVFANELIFSLLPRSGAEGEGWGGGDEDPVKSVSVTTKLSLVRESWGRGTGLGAGVRDGLWAGVQSWGLGRDWGCCWRHRWEGGEDRGDEGA